MRRAILTLLGIAFVGTAMTVDLVYLVKTRYDERNEVRPVTVQKTFFCTDCHIEHHKKQPQNNCGSLRGRAWERCFYLVDNPIFDEGNAP